KEKSVPGEVDGRSPSGIAFIVIEERGWPALSFAVIPSPRVRVARLSVETNVAAWVITPFALELIFAVWPGSGGAGVVGTAVTMGVNCGFCTEPPDPDPTWDGPAGA